MVLRLDCPDLVRLVSAVAIPTIVILVEHVAGTLPPSPGAAPAVAPGRGVLAPRRSEPPAELVLPLPEGDVVRVDGLRVVVRGVVEAPGHESLEQAQARVGQAGGHGPVHPRVPLPARPGPLSRFDSAGRRGVAGIPVHGEKTAGGASSWIEFGSSVSLLLAAHEVASPKEARRKPEGVRPEGSPKRTICAHVAFIRNLQRKLRRS
jgi:hypothetical protein